LKKRVDLLLVDKKITDSRTKAQAMIMAGQISINGKKVLKSGELYETNANIAKANLHPQWVSRGAFKLLYALDNFNIDVKDSICLDLGASTGGFTEVLLSKNAKKIYAVDVGTNQLHEKLSKHTKVINISKTNARYLSKNNFNQVSIISAKNGTGINTLLNEIEKYIKDKYKNVFFGEPSLTRTRHRACLKKCLINLKKINNNKNPELNAEDLRLSINAIGNVTGEYEVEKMLDIVFKDFCIGK